MTTAGMGAARPQGVANRASAMPGATIARLVVCDFEMPMKLFMIPHTVPNRPTNGAVAPIVASTPVPRLILRANAASRRQSLGDEAGAAAYFATERRLEALKPGRNSLFQPIVVHSAGRQADFRNRLRTKGAGIFFGYIDIGDGSRSADRAQAGTRFALRLHDFDALGEPNRPR